MIKDNYMIYRKKKNLDMPSRHSLGDFGQEILRFFFQLVIITRALSPKKHRFTSRLDGLSRIQKVAEGPDTRPSRWR